MIFQYTRVVSQTDSKRHYRWECVSREHEYLFVFLTPNGARYPTLFSNLPSKERTGYTNQPIAYFVDHVNPKDLSVYHKLTEDFPMLPYLFIDLDQSDGLFTLNHFNDSENEPNHFESLLLLVQQCHIEISKMEVNILKYDDDQKQKQQMDAFWNELTNVLTKFDLASCIQSIVKPKT